ncbi:hypothetical protein CJ010_19665 [Azoarcus sp. DD4]|nr:hypothetical protein CJ010_19665 [Azoarcus sp. DD4]
MSRLRERLVATDVKLGFFADVVRFVRRDNFPFSDDVTVDGTLIKPRTSFKRFPHKDGEPPNDSGNRARMVVSDGDKLSNTPYRTSTDPKSHFTRKGDGLCVDILVTESTQAECSKLTHLSVGDTVIRGRLETDNGYSANDFMTHLR